MPKRHAASEPEFDLPARIIWEPDDKEMILIGGGTFTMGRDDGPENQRPANEVSLSAFYIDRYPVTQAEYSRFVQATAYPIPCYRVEWLNTHEYNWSTETHSPPADKLDHPVVLVTWEDACTYAAWALKRLPTEAEWERAARGTDGRRWPWGNEFRQEACNTYGLGIGRTTAVYRFSPHGDSPEGVGDMVGNVWEWTSSLYRPYPYAPEDGREDPEGQGWRVLRGGSWFNDQTMASATARLDGDFVFFTNVGFRCAVPAEVVAAALQGCAQKDS
jgi:formylglycine-generating enzyme required for sulfatase activity